MAGAEAQGRSSTGRGRGSQLGGRDGATGQGFIAGFGPLGCRLMGKGLKPKARPIGHRAGPQGRPA